MMPVKLNVRNWVMADMPLLTSASLGANGWDGVVSCRSALKRDAAKLVSTRLAFSRSNRPPHNGVAYKGRCR